MLSMSDGKLKGEYWAVGGGRALTDVVVEEGQSCSRGKYALANRSLTAGRRRANAWPCATRRGDGDALKLAQHRHVSGGVIGWCRSPASVCRQYPGRT